MSRLSFLMTDAQMYASAAVLCRNRELKPELTKELYRRQAGFQYLPESVWPACRVENGMLVYQGKSYSVVLGDEDNRFPGVTGDIGKVTCDCSCNPPVPQLRCAHVYRENTECWFLVNEGEETIDTQITLPAKSRLGSYDLWTGRSYAVTAKRNGQNVCTELLLPRRGSILLFCCTEEEYSKLEQPGKAREIPKPVFILQNEDTKQIQKKYKADLVCSTEDLSEEVLTLTIEASEMAELKVNGISAGISFWSPHCFEVQGMLHEGTNQLELTVYGSLANRYGKPVPYGLVDL